MGAPPISLTTRPAHTATLLTPCLWRLSHSEPGAFLCNASYEMKRTLDQNSDRIKARVCACVRTTSFFYLNCSRPTSFLGDRMLVRFSLVNSVYIVRNAKQLTKLTPSCVGFPPQRAGALGPGSQYVTPLSGTFTPCPQLCLERPGLVEDWRPHTSFFCPASINSATI